MLSTLRTGSQQGRLTGLIHPLLVSIHSPTFRPPQVVISAACFSSKSPKEGKENTQKSEKPKRPQDKHDDKHPKKGTKNIPGSSLLIALGSTAILYELFANNTHERVEEMMTNDVIKEYVMKGNVGSFEIVNRSQCIVHLRSDTPGKDPHTRIVVQIGSAEHFEAKLEAVQNELGIPSLEHIPIRYATRTSWMSKISTTLPILFAILPLLLIRRGMGSMGSNLQAGPRQILKFGKTSASVTETKSKTKFSDVAGLTEGKKEVLEFVEFLKNPEKFEKLGARLPKGALLAGPPGTGKTLLAKAIAGEADVPFLSMSGSDFVEMFVGVGSSRVRDLFKKARNVAPAIIFIDELDAVGRKRGSGSGGNDERESTLNQLLVEMDGFGSDSSVIVIASTNRADVLDPALLRPGRFDRQIDVQKPDIAERAAIFKVHLRPLTLADDLDIEVVSRRLAALTPGLVGADIASICNESAIFGARRNGKAIDMRDFEHATDRVLAGLAKTNSLMSKETRRTVAVHESGHAVAGWFLEHADPLLKVTVVPRSKGSLGFAQYLPSESGLLSAEALQDRIALALGGRAAEELFVGEITSGAQDDLKKVTQMAYSMVSELGMNKKLGLLSFKETEGLTKPYSEETGEVIDNEVRTLIQEQYDRVKTLLIEKKDVLLALSERLLEKETLVFADLTDVMGERPFGVEEEYRKFVEQPNPFSVVDEPKADTAS